MGPPAYEYVLRWNMIREYFLYLYLYKYSPDYFMHVLLANVVHKRGIQILPKYGEFGLAPSLAYLFKHTLPSPCQIRWMDG